MTENRETNILRIIRIRLLTVVLNREREKRKMNPMGLDMKV